MTIKMTESVQRNHLLIVSPRSLLVLLTTLLLLVDNNNGVHGLPSDEYGSSTNYTDIEELLNKLLQGGELPEMSLNTPQIVDDDNIFERKLMPVNSYSCFPRVEGDICGCALRALIAAYEQLKDTTEALHAIGFNDPTGDGPIVPVDQDRVWIAVVGPNVALDGFLDDYFCSHSTPSGSINQYSSYCPPDQLEDICSDLTAEGGVGSIRLVVGGASAYFPDVPDVGDTGFYIAESLFTLKSDIVSQDYGIAGEHMKIGIISNSFDMADETIITEEDGDGNEIVVNYARDIVTGDLPPEPQVQIQTDRAGSNDEGRAMAQIVYDQVPAAQIFFRTGFGGGEEGFAQSIEDLCFNDKVDVIVEDLFFTFEPFYLPGVIAQAATKVSNAGCTFFSSAGNNYKSSYEGLFNGVIDLDLAQKFDTFFDTTEFQTARFHDFSEDGSEDTSQLVIGRGNGAFTFVLQWDDRWTTYGGNPPDFDFDIYAITDPSEPTIEVLGMFSEDDNTNDSDPVEDVQLSGDGLQFWLVIVARDKPGLRQCSSSSSSSSSSKKRGLVRTGPSTKSRSNLKQRKNDRVLKGSSSSESSSSDSSSGFGCSFPPPNGKIPIKWVEFFNRIEQIGDVTVDQVDSGEKVPPEGVFSGTVVGHRLAENIGAVGATFWPFTPVGVDPLAVEAPSNFRFIADFLNDEGAAGGCNVVFGLEPPGCFTGEASVNATPTVERMPPGVSCCGPTATSQGGTSYLRDEFSNPVEVTELRRPNFMGCDAVSTSFFGTDNAITMSGQTLVPPNEANQTRRFFSGTSAAAPTVAACALLLKQANRNLDSSKVIEILEDTAIDFDPVRPTPPETDPANDFIDLYYQNQVPVAEGFDFLTGYGLVDCAAAMAIVCPATVEVTLDDDRRRKLPEINEANADEDEETEDRHLWGNWGGWGSFNRDSSSSSDDTNEYEIGVDLESGCDLKLKIVEAHITVCGGDEKLSMQFEDLIQDGATIKFTETPLSSNKCSIYFNILSQQFVAEGYDLKVTVTAAFTHDSELIFTDRAILPSSFSRASSSSTKTPSSSKGESKRRRRKV